MDKQSIDQKFMSLKSIVYRLNDLENKFKSLQESNLQKIEEIKLKNEHISQIQELNHRQCQELFLKIQSLEKILFAELDFEIINDEKK